MEGIRQETLSRINSGLRMALALTNRLGEALLRSLKAGDNDHEALREVGEKLDHLDKAAIHIDEFLARDK